jgi:hypothetical protein
MVEEQPSSPSIVTLNKAINNYNLLQLRLDPSNIINEAKMFLNAEIEVVTQDETSGVFKRDIIPIGIPKANKKGIASILNWLQMTVNPQVVQGNFPMDNKGHSEMYNQYIAEFQLDLGDMIYANIYNYGIDEDEAQSIIDAMMNLVKAFMTRPIGNKERESYGETFKEITGQAPPNKNLFNMFK